MTVRALRWALSWKAGGKGLAPGALGHRQVMYVLGKGLHTNACVCGDVASALVLGKGLAPGAQVRCQGCMSLLVKHHRFFQVSWYLHNVHWAIVCLKTAEGAGFQS